MSSFAGMSPSEWMSAPAFRVGEVPGSNPGAPTFRSADPSQKTPQMGLLHKARESELCHVRGGVRTSGYGSELSGV
jgi:hypothetical protein